MGVIWRVFSDGVDYAILCKQLILFRNIEMPVHTEAERRKNAAAKKTAAKKTAAKKTAAKKATAKTNLAASGFKQRKRSGSTKNKGKA